MNSRLKKILIISSHPNENSLCNNIVKFVYKLYENENFDIKIIDLYKENFNSDLTLNDFKLLHNNKIPSDIEKYQKLIKEYKNLIFIFPLWWCSFPAILKGFLDKILSFNWAYKINNDNTVEGLLNEINVDLIYTMGDSLALYKKNNLHNSIYTSWDLGIFKFCRMNLNNIYIFDNIRNNDKNINQIIAKHFLNLKKNILLSFNEGNE